MKQQLFTLADLQPKDTADIEWQVLHDLMNDNDIIPEVVSVIRPDFFTTDGRRGMWNDIVAEFNNGSSVAGYVAFSKLPKDVALEYNAFVERATVNSHINTASTHDQALAHIGVLRDAAARRRAYHFGLLMLQLSHGNDTETDLYSKATTAIQALEDRTVKEEYTIGEVFNQIADDVQERKRMTDAGRKTCIVSGFPNLDNVVDGGFKRGQLVIVAARPSIGKTALAIQMMRNAAQDGNRCVFFSIEMMRDEIGNRMLYSTGLINSYQIWTGKMDWQSFEQAVTDMGRLPILLNDHARNLSDIVFRMNALSRQGKCDIAFVDYLGLINPEDHRIPLYQQIADVTGTLKVTAKRLGIPIVLLCQLNRNAAKEDYDPDLYDLRDSGSIEQDADIVLMLRRRGDDLNILVRKNRHGDSNLRITLRTNDTRTNYEDVGIEKI